MAGAHGLKTRAIAALRHMQRVLYGASAPVHAQAPRAAEILVAAGLLGLFIFAVHWPHIRHGGMVSDDWANLSDWVFAPSPRYPSVVQGELDLLGARPVLALLLPLPAVLAGEDAAGQIALGLAFVWASTAMLYITLRVVGLPARLAALPVALSVVLPASSAVRLWATAALNHATILFALSGVLMTLFAFGARGRRAVALHGAGLLLYVTSVATYEAAGILLLILGPLYLRFAAPEIVLRRWVADIVVVCSALVASAMLTRRVRSVGGGPDDRVLAIPGFVLGYARRLAETMTPLGIPDRLAILPVLITAGALIVARRSGRMVGGSETAGWAWALAAGTVLLAAAAVPFLGSGLGPGSDGLANRANLVAGPVLAGLAIALVGLCIAVSALLLPERIRNRAATLGVMAAGAWLVAGGWADARDQQRAWRASAEQQRAVLDGMQAALPAPRAGDMIYVYGFRTTVAPGVPVFDETWDLWGAARVRYGEGSVRAYPALERTRLRCGARTATMVEPSRPLFEGDAAAEYGGAVAVDVAARTATRLTGPRVCRTVAAAMERRAAATFRD